ARLKASLSGNNSINAWLCISVSPVGLSGFQRHDRAGRYIADRRLTFQRYFPSERRVEINSSYGPVFDTAPVHFGLYGNKSALDANFYLDNNPYRDLLSKGSLNGQDVATDYVAGICMGVFAWQMNLTPANSDFSLDVRLPVDDYRGAGDLAELQNASAANLETNNRSFWTGKLDHSGTQFFLPSPVKHLFDLYRTCRANLLILSDDGEIHPGPTIYDSFWVRDSSVEGIACALSGDLNLAEEQFGRHYPNVFNFGYESIGPVSSHGF